MAEDEANYLIPGVIGFGVTILAIVALLAAGRLMCYGAVRWYRSWRRRRNLQRTIRGRRAQISIGDRVVVRDVERRADHDATTSSTTTQQHHEQQQQQQQQQQQRQQQQDGAPYGRIVLGVPVAEQLVRRDLIVLGRPVTPATHSSRAAAAPLPAGWPPGCAPPVATRSERARATATVACSPPASSAALQRARAARGSSRAGACLDSAAASPAAVSPPSAVCEQARSLSTAASPWPSQRTSSSGSVVRHLQDERQEHGEGATGTSERLYV